MNNVCNVLTLKYTFAHTNSEHELGDVRRVSTMQCGQYLKADGSTTIYKLSYDLKRMTEVVQ